MSEYLLRWLTAVILLLSAPALFAADSYPTVELLESEASRWSQLIKTAGIRPD